MKVEKKTETKTVKGNPPVDVRLPLFYKKLVPLNRDQHRNLYIKAESGFSFARETNSVFVAAVEFPQAALEYPVVFAGTPTGEILPLALLGIRNNQNLFVGEGGVWKARYIPAYVRRYPFILATDEKGTQFTVCIDEGYPGFNCDKEGERLISRDGEDGPQLKRALEFLKDYQVHIARTTEFCETLKSLNVLEPIQANVELKSGEKFALSGLQCVNRTKLKALPDAQIQMLLKKDYLELIYLHMASLNNIHKLLSLMVA
ncbi:MAG TPA: SapC family protein [Gammaproteobacteria bacterium]|nr:SapC family protein [Gammaproteobacteria bacterium]